MPEPLVIGLMADAQYAQREVWMDRHFRASLGKLEEAVQWMNRCRPAFCLHLGDLIDGGWEHFDPALEVLAGLDMPCGHLAGNHDFDVAPERQAKVRNKLGAVPAWRAETVAGWRLVYLDSNAMSTYAADAASETSRQAQQFLEMIEADGRVWANRWNGGLGITQRKWLEQQIKEAAAAGERAVIFAHHPVHPEGRHCLLDRLETAELLREHAGVTAAWINGHDHDGACVEVEGTHFLTLRGMVETEKENAFCLLKLREDRLEIEGMGREPSRVLEI